MIGSRALAVAAALCAAVAAAGCGFGPGDEAGTAELTITRDYGAEVLGTSSAELSESDTVMRVLDRSAEIETRFGGAFVQSIDGLEGEGGSRRSDWFFYVNGIESSIGAGEFRAREGDRIWWDYRDWTDALRTPALVGSWPEPFVHGFDGERWGTLLVCSRPVLPPCRDVVTTVRTADLDLDAITPPRVAGFEAGDGRARILVGTWNELESDPVAGLLDESPSRSGVFARFRGEGKDVHLELLDASAEVAETTAGAGLVAALRPGDGPPTWVVTGTDEAGVVAAADLLGEPLRNHYAVAVAGAEPIPVPVPQ